MTFLLHRPTPPVLHLENCTDAERRIDKTCWNLTAVQAALKDGTLRMILTTSSSEDMRYKLSWLNSHALTFLHVLGHHRYNNSEWCLPPNHNNKHSPMAADSYVMGFDHIKGVEKQQKEPWVYFKFTVLEAQAKVLVLRAHPEKEFN